MIFYISDLHLFDERVFRLCNRNLDFVLFNQKLKDNWNSRVRKNDLVYVVGDVSGDLWNETIATFIDTLNGEKILILGNHDSCAINKYKKVFKRVVDVLYIKDNNRDVFLCHYPTMDWFGMNRDSYHIYGHIHNKNLPEIKAYYKNRLAFNVSCDVIGFTPRTLDELIKIKKENINETFIN